MLGFHDVRWHRARRLISRILLALLFVRFAMRGWVRVNWNAVSDAIDQGEYLQLAILIRESRTLTDGNRNPLYPALLSLFARREWGFFTDAKLLSLLLGLASLALIFYLTRRILGTSVALATVALLSVNDSFQMEASWVRCEILLIPLFYSTWYLVSEGYRDHRLWPWAGVMAGLCQLTKGNGHLLVGAFMLGGLLCMGRRFVRIRWTHAFLLTYLIIISPLLVINTAAFGNPLYNYNTSHALWFDQWEDAYRVATPPPTLLSYLQSHSLSEMWQRQRYGMRRAAIDAAGALLPFFSQDREQRAVAVVVAGLVTCAALLQNARRSRRNAGNHRRFLGTLAFSCFLLLVFYLLFAWYAQVISKPRFFVPLIPVVYAGWSGATANLMRTTFANRDVARSVGRVAYVIVALSFGVWLLYSIGATVSPKGQAVDTLGNPYTLDIERSAPREDVLIWLENQVEEGESVLWGPSHYLPRWKHTPRLEFVPIPVDVGSWSELESYVHQVGIQYWVLDFSTIGRRSDLLGPYFDRHYEQIVLRELPPRWELVYADRKFIYDYCVFRTYPEGRDLPAMSSLSPIGLGPDIQLVAYDISLSSTPSNVNLDLGLHWSAQASVDGDYKVFTHLLDSSGSLHSQHDDRPLYGFWPTHVWKPGQVIVDHHHLGIGQFNQPGFFHVALGLYDGETMERLPVWDVASGSSLGDHLILPVTLHLTGRETQ